MWLSRKSLDAVVASRIASAGWQYEQQLRIVQSEVERMLYVQSRYSGLLDQKRHELIVHAMATTGGSKSAQEILAFVDAIYPKLEVKGP